MSPPPLGVWVLLAYALNLQRKQQIAEELVEAADEENKEDVAKLAEQFLSEDLAEETFCSPKAGNLALYSTGAGWTPNQEFIFYIPTFIMNLELVIRG